MSNELSTKVTTGLVRFSYCRVFKAHARPGNDPKYTMTIIIPKDDKKTIRDIKRAIANAIELGKEKWKGKVPRDVKTTFYDGDEERPDDEAYENSFYVACSSKSKPGLVDKNLDEILDEEDLQSGFYGRVALNFYPYDVDGSKGISAGLNHVQVLKKGKVLGGGRSSAEEAFGSDLELDEDDFEERKPKKKLVKRRDDDDDEEEAPRRRKTSSHYSDDDDEDEAPRRKKSNSRHDDDDEEEAPRRKKRPVDDDDDEEEAPRRRKTSSSGSAKKRSRSLIDDDDDLPF